MEIIDLPVGSYGYDHLKAAEAARKEYNAAIAAAKAFDSAQQGDGK